MGDSFVSKLAAKFGYSRTLLPQSKKSNSILDKLDTASSSFMSSIEGLIGRARDFNREELYTLYEFMLQDSIVSAAIETFVDDCLHSQSMAHPEIVMITSTNTEVQEELRNFLYDILNVDDFIYDWAFQLATYGDFFVVAEGKEGEGVIAVDDSRHPSDFKRVEFQGKLIGFIYKDDVEFKPWEVNHFYIGGQLTKEKRKYTIKQENVEREIESVAHYGKSLLSNSYRDWRLLYLSELYMLGARISKSALQRLIKVKVPDGMEPAKAAERVRKISQLLKRSLNPADLMGKTGDVMYSAMAFGDDVVVPVSDTADISVDTLGETPIDVKGIRDVEYLKARLISSLKVPPAFLGFTENLPGSLGESALVRLSVRYANTVRRLSSNIKVGLKRLCQIHYAYKTGKFLSPEDFDISLNELVTASEMEKLSSIDKLMDIYAKIVEQLDATGFQYDKQKFFVEYMSHFMVIPGIDLHNMMEIQSQPSTEPADPARVPNEVPGTEEVAPTEAGSEESVKRVATKLRSYIREGKAEVREYGTDARDLFAPLPLKEERKNEAN